MASGDIHLKQGNHNERLAKQLSSGVNRDWACTCAFYAALHYVEKKIFDCNFDGIRHTEDAIRRLNSSVTNRDPEYNSHFVRESLMHRYFKTDARSSYKHLTEWSKSARYLWNVPKGKTAFDHISSGVVSRLIEQDLVRIKQEAGI